MYGHPALTAFGPERIDSLSALVEAVKRRQLLRPQGRLAVTLGERKFGVNLLPNGFIEWDGSVPPLPVERQIEHEIGRLGALLDDEIA
jgi:hypothetical protein